MQRTDYTRHIYGFVIVAILLVALGSLSLWGIARSRAAREAFHDSIADWPEARLNVDLVMADLHAEDFERDLLTAVAVIMFGGMGLAVALGISIANNQRVTDEFSEQLISIASHQLKTPITVYKWSLTSLEDTGLNEGQQDIVRRMSGNADVMVRVVNDLLDISRIDQGRFAMEPKTFDLAELVNEEIALAEPYAGDRRITVREPEPSPELPVFADRARIAQAIRNLIENAVKYADKGTDVHVHIAQHENFGVVEVTNRGIGIPVAEQGRIFQRFYRASNAGSGGTGLGLSIVKTIVEQSDGSITFRSVPGDETTFTLALPLTRAGSSAPQS